MRDMETVYEQFLQMEADRNLFDTLKVDNVKIWMYIRYPVYGWLVEIIGGYKNPNNNVKNFNYENTFINWFDDNIVKSQFRVRKADALIVNHHRRVKQGKYYKCIYTDEWLKEFDKSYYVFERKYDDKIHFKPVKTENLRYIDLQLYMKLFKKSYSIDKMQKEIKKCVNYISDMLDEVFEVCVPFSIKKNIHNYIEYVLWGRMAFRDYYNFLLKRIQPKIIIYVIGYCLDNMVLAELGKELGIPTVEIAHGHMGKGQLAYNFKDNVKLNTFPDYLFVQGQHEIDTIRLPIPRENVYAVGSPELDKKVEYYNNILENKKKKRKIVTFISSGEYEIADAAVELSQKLDESEYKIYLKLHPSEYTNWKDKYENLEKSNVEVVSDSKHDIYYYLAVSDYIIGIVSTVLFEATRFDCNILIYKVGRYFNSESLVQTQNGVYIDSMDEAVKYISERKTIRKETDYFYCGNSTELIQKAIDDIIQKNKVLR